MIWSGFGGALGGAISGGVLSSYLQSRYSNKNISKKDHFSDLKKDIVEPLIVAMSEPNFSSRDSNSTSKGPESTHFRIDSLTIMTDTINANNKLKSNNILFQDFIVNHYPQIYSSLKEVSRLMLYASNKRNRLSNVLETNIGNVFCTIEADLQTSLNKNIITLLIRNIVDNNYDQSYFRITDYGTNRFLYFSPVEDYNVPFYYKETHVIFSSHETDAQFNAKRVSDVRSVLIERIEQIINQLKNEAEDYNRTNDSLIHERNRILASLLTIKYSTKLRFEREKLRNKCSLT
jgi:hypothetical protein